MYLALYRRFRPETFQKVLGQEHIVKILKNQIREGATGHAYLFCGTRGTGKTTMARLLAKGVNCTSEGERPCGLCDHCMAIKDGIFLDVAEIDAASNNGVDNIREIRESVKYPPAEGSCKVYIIDEVHMLSAGAFNALLKTLEEPPENVMFILATTEAQKLPATILSRCLRLDFKRVPAAVIKQGMESICEELEVDAASDALALLAANADGSVRDALSLLDQCLAAGGNRLNRDIVLELLGSPAEDQLIELTDYVYRRDVSSALVLIDELLSAGKEERQIMRDWIEHFRNLMLLQHVKKPEDVLNLSIENIEKLKAQGGAVQPDFIKDSIFALAKVLNDARWTSQPRVLLEVAVIRMSVPESDEGVLINKRPTVPGVPRQSSKSNTGVDNHGETKAGVSTVGRVMVDTQGAGSPEKVGESTEAVSVSPAEVGESTEVVSVPPAEVGESTEAVSVSPAEVGESTEVVSASPAEVAGSPEVFSKSATEVVDSDRETAEKQLTVDDIDWDGIITEAIKGRKRLSRLKGRTRPVELTASRLVIDIGDSITLDMAKEIKEDLEEAIFKKTGAKHYTEFKLNEHMKEPAKPTKKMEISAEGIAKLEQMLGGNIEIN
jgi:DNA polymerase-3 subunit gamma/tau